MKRGSWSIVLACAIGALVGSLLGLEMKNYTTFESGWCAFAGMLFGSAVAYVTIDFPQLCAGVSRAYHEVLAWQANPLYWRANAYALATIGIVLISIMFWMSLGILAIGGSITALSEASLTLSAVAALVLMIVMYANRYFYRGSRRHQLRNLAEDREVYRFTRKHLNPIMMAFWILRGIIVMMKTIVIAYLLFVYRSAVNGARFAKLTFIYIHSTRRTICLVDAGIGSLVGYSYGSVVIGLIAGGLLGFVNYEFVSIRLLKLTVRR